MRTWQRWVVGLMGVGAIGLGCLNAWREHSTGPVFATGVVLLAFCAFGDSWETLAFKAFGQEGTITRRLKPHLDDVVHAERSGDGKALRSALDGAQAVIIDEAARYREALERRLTAKTPPRVGVETLELGPDGRPRVTFQYELDAIPGLVYFHLVNDEGEEVAEPITVDDDFESRPGQTTSIANPAQFLASGIWRIVARSDVGTSESARWLWDPPAGATRYAAARAPS